MIEALYDAIRAVAGQPITLNVRADDGQNPITENCRLVLQDENEVLFIVDGKYTAEVDLWNFQIPAELTKGMNGRYWYCIQHNEENLHFKQPFYLKG